VTPFQRELLKNSSNVSGKSFYELICLYLEPGEFVDADEIIARIETDKVTVDIQAPIAGVIQEYFAGEGDTVEVGADFYVIDPDATGGSAPAAPKAAAPATPTPAAEAPKAAPTPVAAAPTHATPPPAQAPPSGSNVTSTTAKKAPSSIEGTRSETRVPMNRMRLRIADRLKDA